MSAIVKLAGVLPKDPETNGIDHLKDALIEHPDRLRYFVAAARTRSINTVVESGVKVPTIEIERIEYVGDPTSVPDAVVKAFMDAAQDRTGHEPLPYDETEPNKPKVTYDLADEGEPIFGDDEQ